MAFDFDSYLNAALVSTFGEVEPAFYEPAGQSGFELLGIFTRDHVEVVLDTDGAPISARQTTYFARRTDFPPGVIPVVGDSLTISGATYAVADVQPDAIGGLVLILAGRGERDNPEP